MDEKVIIYTDGACSGNPGPGGWGAILMFNDVKKEIKPSSHIQCISCLTIDFQP